MFNDATLVEATEPTSTIKDPAWQHRRVTWCFPRVPHIELRSYDSLQNVHSDTLTVTSSPVRAKQFDDSTWHWWCLAERINDIKECCEYVEALLEMTWRRLSLSI